MTLESAWWLPLSGLIIGVIMGYVARSRHFCTLSALERYWYANDGVGLRTWVLAIAVAIVSTQSLQGLGLVDVHSSFYLEPRLNLTGAVLGGLLFGIGMALVGTCGFGALVRLGGGSLRSLIVVLGIGLAALTAQRGLIGQFRQAFIESRAFDLRWAGEASITGIANALTGQRIGVPLTVLLIAALFVWVFKDAAFRHRWQAIASAMIIGLCVTAGWLITGYFGQILFEPVQLESASFVLPPGDLLLHFIAFTGTLPDYGVGLTLGVVAGAAASARISDDVRWEACDDARELGRHLTGAFLMGTGGIFAAGCTIGQGISAASTLAISAPIVFVSIMAGARLGLAWLLEGSVLSLWRR